jgi:hypothetical protein
VTISHAAGASLPINGLAHVCRHDMVGPDQRRARGRGPRYPRRERGAETIAFQAGREGATPAVLLPRPFCSSRSLKTLAGTGEKYLSASYLR